MMLLIDFAASCSLRMLKSASPSLLRNNNKHKIKSPRMGGNISRCSQRDMTSAVPFLFIPFQTLQQL